jgi:hypothetical protein
MTCRPAATLLALLLAACGGSSSSTGDAGDDAVAPDGDVIDDTPAADAPDECIPDCEGRTCGDDGCGGTCGPGCGDSEACVDGTCVAGSAHVLYNTNRSNTTHLVNMDTREIVHSWTRSSTPGNTVYLLENGNLLRPQLTFMGRLNGGGAGGLIEEIDWDNDLVWSYTYASDTYKQHHDAIRLPSGNTLFIAWEVKSEAEAVQAGRDESVAMWPDHLVEVEPTGSSGGTIVWEWHAWDHLIQDHDPSVDNHGVVADHPELIDVNLGTIHSGGPGGGEDWLHLNAVDYNEELDQVIVSSHTLCEVWVIDHSTTTEEAAGHTGGNSGMGGDLLYRWGNPANYGAGTSADQRLFVVHAVSWIRVGLPGEGHILLFNNGDGRPEGNFSSADEIVSPVDSSGAYPMSSGVWGPSTLEWTYSVGPMFYSNHISSAQRLASGNTFICEGTSGYIFEVTPSGETVWDHDAGMETPRAYRYEADYPGLARLHE